MNTNIISSYLKFLRKSRHFTQDELAEKLDISRIADFEQISKIPQDELKEILEQFDADSLVIASMGASPEVNRLLEKLSPDIDYGVLRNRIGRIRIEEVERIQNEIVSMINLHILT